MVINVIPGGDGFVSNEVEADILNGLSDRVQKDDFGGETASFGDQGDRVDDRHSIEESLDEDFPDRSNVAIFDVDGAQKEGDTEGEKIELNDSRNSKKPRKARSDTIDKGKNNDDYEVDEHINNGGESGRDDDDIFRKTDFAEKVTAVDNGLDALHGAFGEETPHGSTNKKVNWIMRDVATDFEKFSKNDVENSKHHEWAKESPEIAEDGALIAELEIGFCELL